MANWKATSYSYSWCRSLLGMEKIAGWNPYCRVFLSGRRSICLKSSPRSTVPGKRLKLFRICNSLQFDQGRRVSQLPVAAVKDSAVPAQSDDFQLENAVAALEQAFIQVSSTEIDERKNTSFELSAARTVKSSKSTRLSLRSRIKLAAERLSSAANSSGSSVDAADDNIWSSAADDLIRSSYDHLEVVDWRNLHHGYLTSEEEIRLVELIKPMTHLRQIRAELQRVLRRDPSDDEWAIAATMEFRTLRRKLQLGQAAQNKLIQHNCRLVLFLARKHEREAGSFSLEDLCQEGVKGLIDAMDHFNPQKGARFSTYAIFWIRTTILRAITRTGQIMRLPLRYASKKLEIRRAKRDLRDELGRAPTDAEVMDRVGLDADQYRTIQNSNFRVRSLNDTMSGTDEELLEYLPERGEIVTDFVEFRAEVEKLLDQLKPKEKLVLKHRFGIEDGLPVINSLREVGKRLNMSQEMVRKYEARALKELKQRQDELRYLRSCLPSTV